jgi:hypothetical protein
MSACVCACSWGTTGTCGIIAVCRRRRASGSRPVGLACCLVDGMVWWSLITATFQRRKKHTHARSSSEAMQQENANGHIVPKAKEACIYVLDRPALALRSDTLWACGRRRRMPHANPTEPHGRPQPLSSGSLMIPIFLGIYFRIFRRHALVSEIPVKTLVMTLRRFAGTQSFGGLSCRCGK